MSRATRIFLDELDYVPRDFPVRAHQKDIERHAAARGQLGLEGPTIVAQVKAREQQADVKELRELIGVMNARKASAGLFVSWNGFTRPALREARDQWFNLRLWTSVDVVSAVLRVYEKLPEDVQLRIPLERVWILVNDADEVTV